MTEPINDIVSWSATQPEWRRDCLRRLAECTELSEGDREELLAMIKAAAGFNLMTAPPVAIPFTKDHFIGREHEPIILKSISNVKGVNRLKEDANLNFGPSSLTIVYGRNGSGKSGFVRILRAACRTRIERQAVLKVLPDAYAENPPSPSANFIATKAGEETCIPWTPDSAPSPFLKQIGVFDSNSAQIYVDSGSHIHFLPFGLELPHRLNGVCSELKSVLEGELEREVGSKIPQTKIKFNSERSTKAQIFYQQITSATTDDEIDAATKFSQDDEERLTKIATLLTTSATASADMSAFAQWSKALVAECGAAIEAYSDEALGHLTKLKKEAESARMAAKLAADSLFLEEPLEGVGSDSWRALWEAARDYSVSAAYLGKEFPVTNNDGEAANCVLCQQPLLDDGAARLQRFQSYMDDTLDAAATNAERAIDEAKRRLPALTHIMADDLTSRAEQVRARDAALADKLLALQRSLADRAADALARLDGKAGVELPKLAAPLAELTTLANNLEIDADTLTKARSNEEQQNLKEEKSELEDRKTLATNHETLTGIRNLKIKERNYNKALTLVATTGITRYANDLLDSHLSAAVMRRFKLEREWLGIEDVKVGLSRKSGKLKAQFQTETNTKITKITSQILSEGEQRALALAGFFTEVALTEGAGPVVIDDPVSSLDRERSTKVADRIAEISKSRQVIIFTHDIVFFNEVCRAADEIEIEPSTVSIFSDQNSAGNIDDAGMAWKGLDVKRRIGQIKNKFAPLPKLYKKSPSDYEIEIKGLYGRLRDTYERMVEEIIFKDVIRRGADVIQTQLLRYVAIPDDLAIKFHRGMTRANTYSHDNPASDTVSIPTPAQFEKDIDYIEKLIDEFKSEHRSAETRRPQMKIRK